MATTTTTTTVDTSLDFDPYGTSNSAALLGGAGNDRLFGGAGNDILNGGAGSDDLKSGSGDDTMVYRLAENAGAKDIYTGGSGKDTIRLHLTQDEWETPAIRAQLELYVSFLTTVKRSPLGEVSNGLASDFTFNFGNGTTLTVQMTETLVVAVNNVEIDYHKSLITGPSTGCVTEAGGAANASPGVPTATGDLYADDLDVGAQDDLFAQMSAGTATTYGSYELTANGVWTYTLNNLNAAVQALNVGGTLTDSFTVLTADGGSKVVSITINGTNDNAVITGTATDNVTEAGGVANGTVGDPSASGTLIITDVDAGQAVFQTPASLAGTYGNFTFNATSGAWTYTLDNTHAATQALTAAQVVHDTLTVTSIDGTASQVIDVTVAGANDAAVITGDISDSVIEAGGVANGTPGTATATGDLLATDVDNTLDAFQAVGAGAATTKGYGTYGVTAAGVWTYTLDDANTTVQGLNVGDSASDTFTVKSADGTEQVVTVTINGRNDAAVITGDISDSVIEAGGVANGTPGDNSASGSLSVSDVDAGQAVFQTPPAASLAGTYGSFTFNAANGAWTYALDNTRAATQALIAAQVAHDTLTVSSVDGTASQVIDVTVTGANDVAVISGDAVGAATEDANPSTISETGTLSVADVDAGENVFDTASVTNTTVAAGGALGDLAITAAGVWTYTVANADVQYLGLGDTRVETFTVDSADGTDTQTITVTITGTNDVAVISGTKSGSVTEDSATTTASGTLTAADVDNTANLFQAAPAGSATVNGYGSFQMTTAGVWTYTLNNSNATVNALNTGGTLSDSFAVLSADGTSQLVNVTINGHTDITNSAPTNITLTALEPGTSLPGGGVLATVFTTDADAGDTHTYTITTTSPTGGATTFTAPSGNLTSSAALGANNVYVLVIQATDSGSPSASVTETFRIITGSSGNDTTLGGSGSATEDILYGFNDTDIIFGGGGDDTLFGQKGTDTLKAGSGNDFLYGGDDDDSLAGGDGNDLLNGGAGKDEFVFNTVLGATNVDTITDFVSGTDKIHLENAIFTIFVSPGTLNATAFEVGATATSATTRIVYNQTTGALFYDADGNAGGTAIQIAIIGTTTHPMLTAGDFTII